MNVKTTGINGMRLGTLFITGFMVSQIVSYLLSGLIITGIIQINNLVIYNTYYFPFEVSLTILGFILPVIAGALILRNRHGFPNEAPKLIWGSILMILIFPGLILQLLISVVLTSHSILVHQIPMAPDNFLDLPFPFFLLIQFLTNSIGTLLIGLVLLNRKGIILLWISTFFYALLPILGITEWLLVPFLGTPRSIPASVFWYFYNSYSELIIASILFAISFFFFYKYSDKPPKRETTHSIRHSKDKLDEDNMIVFEKDSDKFADVY